MSAFLFFLFPSSLSSAETVRTADGREVPGLLTALDAAQATIQRQGAAQTVRLSELVSVIFASAPAEDPMARKGQQVLWTSDGSCLAVRDISIRQGRLQALTDLAGSIALPLDRAARLLRPSADETPGQLEQVLARLEISAGREDVLVVRTPDGTTVPMKGVLSVLAQGQVVFAYEGAETAMEDKCIAIVLFAVSRQAAVRAVPAGVVLGADGSRVAFSGVRLDAKGLAVESPALGALAVARERLAEIRFRQEGMVFLSDLAPAEARHTPFLDDEFPWQKDRSVSGRPLVLAGVRHEKGLGLHAQCRLVFDLRGAYRRFSALAGIDDELRSGKAVLSILGDGRPLADRLLLDRCSPPHRLELDLRGVRSLTIQVDFAEGTFGSGARVNLCDPVLAIAGQRE